MFLFGVYIVTAEEPSVYIIEEDAVLEEDSATATEIIAQADISNINWTESHSFPSKYSALLCVKADASVSGTFTEAGINIWDANGTLIAEKTESGLSNYNPYLYIWYDVYSEIGVLLNPASRYTYQFSTVVNGNRFQSPIYSFTTESDGECHYGIDVSVYQGNIDWATASKYIDFAIIRCGWAADYTSNDDTKWQQNVQACESYGIPYGVYLFSYAENLQEAESEADHVIRLLKGHTPSLPVYLDLEDNNTVGRLSAAQIWEQTKAFCTKIKNAGYEAGVYASKSWWSNHLYLSDYNQYSKWTAIYSGTYAENADASDIWQYSSSGRVPGISGNVDINYMFRNPAPSPTPTCSHLITVTESNKEPTCTEEGYTGAVRCSSCGTVISERQSIPALGHMWGDWKVVREATATEDGEEVRTCIRDSSHTESRVIRHSGETSAARLTVSSADAGPGETTDIQINLVNNPGIAYLEFIISYDPSKISLVGTKDGCLSGWVINSESSDSKAVWVNADENSSNGTILTLSFKIKENAGAGSTTVSLTDAVAYGIDADVLLTSESGRINISDRMSGDVNSDRKLDGRDLIRLKQYLAGYEVDINQSNTDVTGDGKIDGRDVIRLCRYFAGYDVTLD